MEALGFVWEVLVAIAVPIIIFALLGRWLDRTLDTHPWFTVAGFPCAFALAYRIISSKAERFKRDVYDEPRDDSKDDSNKV